MTRARTDIVDVDHDVTAAFKVLRDTFPFPDGSAEDTALCSLETFAAIALRVMAKTNPSKIRSEAMNVEIQARMDGVLVVQGVQ